MIDLIGEGAWVKVEDYPKTGEAQIAETKLGDWRLIVRRTRLVGARAQLFPGWRYFAFATNRTEALELRIPARLTRTARQWTLRMPARWPWQQDFDDALERIRALPALT